MLEVYGDIWELFDEQFEAVVITTNGTVKKNGEAVMGRGVALQAKERYPGIAARLGQCLQQSGNVPCYIGPRSIYPKKIFSLPVKHHWRDRADLQLIVDSILILDEGIKAYELEKVVMPRPGCGNGGLKWEDVKPAIKYLLDDRYTIAYKPA